MNKVVWSAILFVLGIPLAAAAPPLMYIPAGNSNDLMILDLKTDRIVGRIDELENAHGLAGSLNSDYLVAGSMKPLDQESGQTASKPAAINEDEHAAHHVGEPEQENRSHLSIVHLEHKHVMRRIPVHGLSHHIAMSPDGSTAIAVHSGKGSISVVDLKKNQVLYVIKTGGWANYAVFHPDGSRLYVSNAMPGTVSEIDTRQWKVVREIEVGKKPEHMAMTADGTRLFTANVDEGTASVVDLDQWKVVKRYEIGRSPHGIDSSDDGRWLFISSKGDDKLVKIDLQRDTGKTVELAPAPYHVKYVDELQKLYVTSRKAPMIWVLNPETLEAINEIDIKQGVAHQMVVRE